MKKGDIVRTWFDTGAFGTSILHGVVERAGPVTFTVSWRSGHRNRVRRDSPGGVTIETDPDLLAEARKKLGLPDAVQAEITETTPHRHRGAERRASRARPQGARPGRHRGQRRDEAGGDPDAPTASGGWSCPVVPKAERTASNSGDIRTPAHMARKVVDLAERVQLQGVEDATWETGANGAEVVTIYLDDGTRLLVTIEALPPETP